MTDNEQPTPVIFRRYRSTKDVVAIFPTLPADNCGHLMTCYEHIGQHGACDYHQVMLGTTTLVKLNDRSEDVTDIEDELHRIGYRNLKRYLRVSPDMDAERILVLLRTE